MKTVNGIYNSAKIFTDVVDDISLNQVKLLCDQEFTKESKIRLMPDVHAGKGCTIGTTMTIKDKIVPNLVGVDISCGLLTVELSDKVLDLQKLDSVIHEKIPSGMNIRETPHFYSNEIDLTNLKCFDKINSHRAIHSIGTLGGGNHFIEVDKDDDGKLYLVIHSGSRNLGKQVAEYYQDEAFKRLNHKSEKDLKELIDSLKEQGNQKEIQKAIGQFKSQKNTSKIPKDLAYVENDLFDDYINDMKVMQKYANLNRNAMAKEIIEALSLNVVDMFTTTHNYIDTTNMILRKGAVSAQLGEILLIPINMRDGSLICKGKGNPDWNCSAPHGAGRLFSRISAVKTFSLDDYQKEMKGIYTTCISKETLDECPMAYKNIDDIVNNITDTVDILKTIKPIYNFKASE